MVLSIVVPCYNEQEVIPLFFQEISSTAAKIKSEYDVDCEFIFVDDGSSDNTLSLIKQLHEQASWVRYISFSRNFGKEAGILAGLRAAKGDIVGLMDADLQDPPEVLLKMLDILMHENYDIAASRRVSREGEPPIRSFFARLFYKIINRISDADIVDGARDFRLMRRTVVDAVLSMEEYNRFSKGIFGWVGFRTKWLEYVNVQRAAGETKWSFWKLFLYSLEGIIGFSTVPLAIASVLGVLFCVFGFADMLYILIYNLGLGNPVSFWNGLVCLLMIFTGVQLFCVGISAQYLSRTYLEVKHRPKYIVRETEEYPFHPSC